MPKVQFENRAVAFIDVLGFKNVVDAAEQGGKNRAKLEMLIKSLEDALPNLNKTVNKSVPVKLIPKPIYISDSIILSAPLTSSKRKDYCGLSILVMRIIQIGQSMLFNGYLIRGGISVGAVWHTESNIVGSAYQEAYQIETKTLVPRIELSSDAKKYWDCKVGQSNTMCLDYRSKFMVNLLHDYYIPDKSPGAAERCFEEYCKIIDSNLKNNNHPEAVRFKWWWFKEYLESEVKRNDFIRYT